MLVRYAGSFAISAVGKWSRNIILFVGNNKRISYINCINHHVATTVEQHFFSQRVLNVWNALPGSVDFASLNKFKQSILHIDFNDHLSVDYWQFYVQVLFEFMFVTLDYRKRSLAWLFLSVR